MRPGGAFVLPSDPFLTEGDQACSLHQGDRKWADISRSPFCESRSIALGTFCVLLDLIF